MAEIYGWNDDAVRQWARDSSELRNRLAEVADEVADLGAAMAPVSSRGSLYSPSGAFKARGFTSRDSSDSDGIPYSVAKEAQFPGSFLGNASRRVRNANRVRGIVRHYGYRVANRLFIQEAARSLYGSSKLMG